MRENNRSFGTSLPVASSRGRLRHVAGGVALVLASSSLIAASGASAVAAKPTLTIGIFNACGAGISPLGNVLTLDTQVAYEPLIRRRPGNKYWPGLAVSWSVRPGNKVMTLRLRRNARFSDGSHVTASAVKTWLDFRATKNTQFNATMGPIRTVEVVSRFVVRITLKSPNPIFALALSQSSDWGVVASPRAVAAMKADPNNAILNRQTFGAGPYVLLPSATVFGDRCTYVPNRFYYNKARLKWSRIVTKKITEPNAVLAAMRTGQIDVMDGGDAATASAARAAGIKVTKDLGLYLILAIRDRGGRRVPALGDVRVRRALNYAVDRRKIATGLYGRDAVPTSMPIPASDGASRKYRNFYPYNPARARALLAAAGYRNGFTFDVATTGPWAGVNLNLGPLTEAVARDLAAVGVRMEVRTTATSAEWLSSLRNASIPGISVPLGATVPTFQWYQAYYTPAGGGLITDQYGWRDRVLDRLFLQGQRAAPSKGRSIWQKVIGRAVEQAHWLPVASTPQYRYSSKRVGGVTALVGNGPYDWYPVRR